MDKDQIVTALTQPNFQGLEAFVDANLFDEESKATFRDQLATVKKIRNPVRQADAMTRLLGAYVGKAGFYIGKELAGNWGVPEDLQLTVYRAAGDKYFTDATS